MLSNNISLLTEIQELNQNVFENIFQIDNQKNSIKFNDWIFVFKLSKENEWIVLDIYENELFKLPTDFSERKQVLITFLENIKNDRLYIYYYQGTERITVETGKRSGQPCIRGMRLTAGDVLDYLGSGMTFDEILEDFSELERADIVASLNFAIYLIKKTYAPQTL